MHLKSLKHTALIFIIFFLMQSISTSDGKSIVSSGELVSFKPTAEVIDELTQYGEKDIRAGFSRAYSFKGINEPLKDKEVFLTFDDGPSPNNTIRILNILKANGVKATFFVVGKKVQENPQIIKKINDEGMCICAHTFSHEYRIYRSEDTYFDDLNMCCKVIYDIAGIRPIPYIRFPGGSDNLVSDQTVLQNIHTALKQRGIGYVDWNVSAEDAADYFLSPSAISTNVIRQCSDNSLAVVLMHDSYYKNNTVEALPDIIKYLKSEGYVFKTFDNLTPLEYDKMVRYKIMNR